ncbi:t-complex protein 1, delta SU (nucleomorph) [Guillardia theta]|uniref:T-complex protein 1 subunit delta n=1 Tax=Guillardia theta TaxID=55529 RepID=Q98RX6_GUITH|nr:t-complex protein 1, delta SU [Guillardia theta]AAK39824.1 t-complex protein 1, delta SU [Guillardia theta]|mmetsp:Transcript_16968/g.56195  ORF Transcript_16968/g.56195 Transcript_16968/m.56195 type:complete len:520 (+) Transcript_16968:221-1780(+)
MTFDTILLNKYNTFFTNCIVAGGLSDSIKTSFGPHGMDKMIQNEKGYLITNDGATILKSIKIDHPVAKILVNLSKTQDIEAGDGTTSVVLLGGKFLSNSVSLIKNGIKVMDISNSFKHSLKISKKIIAIMSMNINLNNKSFLKDIVHVALESKLVSTYSKSICPISVDSIISIMNNQDSHDVDIKNIRIIKKIGKNLSSIELINGIVTDYTFYKKFNGTIKLEYAKIAIIQFSISNLSTDLDNSIILRSYSSMDKLIREEKKHILSICNKIKSSGCNLIIIQKSIMKESISMEALEILSNMKILVIKDVERDEISYLSESLGCIPIVDIESISEKKLGIVRLVEEKFFEDGSLIFFKKISISYCLRNTILVRASNAVLLDEAERSLIDALSVMRSIIRRRYFIPGGGTVEIEISSCLNQFQKTLTGIDVMCVESFRRTIETIPYVLSENSGMEPIQIISKLKEFHKNGKKFYGIDARKNKIVNALDSRIISPLLVFTSMLNLSIEFAIQMFKIDEFLII